MLLINLARTLIVLLAFVVADALRVAYGLEGVALAMVWTLFVFLVFTLGDIAEMKLIEFFNREEASG